jgi:protein-L-isoaspartate(D-aspartate) O-methyltransferase
VTQTARTADPRSASELREAMADSLVSGGWVSAPEVEAAFRAVPRHLFVPPGTPLETAYATNAAPIAKTRADGVNLSSVSAPWLQALMIAQAGIEPGMRVLEIGSAGYNAALLAEVTGDEGLVVTMDIDPDITARASAALQAAGYGDRVTVVTADGEHGVPELAPFDAIVVTTGSWDVPAAWRDQVAEGGTLVLPLRVNQVSRSLALRREGDHWRSASAQMAGFVPVQGIGAHQEQSLRLPDLAGGHVTLRFDATVPDVAPAALESGPQTLWSGVMIAPATSFEDLHLWLAGFLPGFCKVAASEGTALAALGAGKGWFPFGCASGGSFAYLASRRVDGDAGPEFEFGAGGYGPRAADVAQGLVAQVREWDRAGRDLPGDAFEFWPAGTPIPERPGPTGVFPKAAGTVTVSWAGARRWRTQQPSSRAATM